MPLLSPLDREWRKSLDRRMTVPAINVVVSHVMRVAELKRLFDELVGAGDIRWAPEDDQETDRSVGKNLRDDKTALREGFGAAIKNLRHRMLYGRTRAPGACINCSPGGAVVGAAVPVVTILSCTTL